MLVATMSLLFFSIAALIVDLGQARLMRREAQAASDSSALAAGNALYLAGTQTPDFTGAVAAAKSYASKNYRVTEADWLTCTDPAALDYKPSTTSCISFDDDHEPTSVRVVAPLRTTEFTFASMIGFSSVDISASAEASVRLSDVSDCALCVVGDGFHDLQNGDATITGGDVAINGDVNIQNNGLVSNDGVIRVEGVATGPLDGYTPDPLVNQPAIEDPLANAGMPTASGLTVKTDPCGTGTTHGPGIYGDFNFPGTSCVLQPGLYVVVGSWSLAGNSALDGSAGVTLFFTCGTTSAVTPCAYPGQAGGWLNASGNGNVTLTAPSSGPYDGLAIAYDRLNISRLLLSGNGSSTYSGTIYALSATMTYDGNSCSRTNDSLVIVDDLEFNGNNACLSLTYDGEKNMPVPPSGLHLSR